MRSNVDDFNFQVEDTKAFIQRSLHRLYNCSLTTVHLKKERANEY